MNRQLIHIKDNQHYIYCYNKHVLIFSYMSSSEMEKVFNTNRNVKVKEIFTHFLFKNSCSED